LRAFSVKILRQDPKTVLKYHGSQRRATSCGPKHATALDWHTLEIELGPHFGNAWILGHYYSTQNSQKSQISLSFSGCMRGLKIRVKRSYHWHLELSKSSQSLVTINQAESSLPQRCQKVPKNSRNSLQCRHLTPTYCGAGVNPFTSFSLKKSFAYHQCCEKSEVLTERKVTNER